MILKTYLRTYVNKFNFHDMQDQALLGPTKSPSGILPMHMNQGKESMKCMHIGYAFLASMLIAGCGAKEPPPLDNVKSKSTAELKAYLDQNCQSADAIGHARCVAVQNEWVMKTSAEAGTKGGALFTESDRARAISELEKYGKK